MSCMKDKTIKPGIVKGTLLNHFTVVENKIVNTLAERVAITFGGGQFKAGHSDYKYCFVKLPDTYSEIFGLNREILTFFSYYKDFAPRTIDALDKFLKTQGTHRLDKLLSIVISGDPDIEQKVTDILRNEKESQIVIPFNYNELIGDVESSFIRNRIKKHFYEKDLFDFDSPLRTELYFFGRSELIHEAVDKHIAKENSGIFGLRKVGKTSLLFSIERAIEDREGWSIVVDCQKLHLQTWNMALFVIAEEIKRKYGVRFQLEEKKYTPEGAPRQFERFINNIFSKQKQRVLIILDEIEQITFEVSPSHNWRSGEDFIKFWHVLRGLFQSSLSPISYLIAGTNPLSIERASINKIDNPIFSQITPKYVTPFDVPLTTEMITKLSAYMGLKFDDDVCTYICKEYGGHPFLMRKICSYIHNNIEGDRPVRVDRNIYRELKAQFDAGDGRRYSEMVLNVLEEFYPNELVMLEMLAVGNYREFKEFADLSPEYTEHLIGYGIVDKNDFGYDFRIDLLKDYIKSKNKYKKIDLTLSEKLSEIGKRRNAIEPKLQKIVKQLLQANLGKDAAKKLVLAKHDAKKKARYSSLEYSDLFDSNKHEIYFNDLLECMRKKWDECFRNIFEEDVEKFQARMIVLNSIGRADCHAKDVSEADFMSFRGAMKWLEDKVESYL